MEYINKSKSTTEQKEEDTPIEQKCLKNGLIIPIQGIRKVIAARMKESLITAAQANHRMDVDMSRLLSVRSELNALNEKLGIKISITDMLIKIVTQALLEQPIINSTIVSEGILLLDEINIGIAVATDSGLLVPVIHNTKGKTLIEIGAITKEFIEKTRTGKLKPDEMKGGTFTITNLGMYDVDSFTAIINPPESAILAVGRVNKRVVVVDDNIVIKPITTLSLTYDHRVIDGAPAAIFLQRIKQLIENPYLLL
jgi:pyruvate dehydrogenase E2 component (dihydrolipoamide acetyltransferase)